MRLQLFFHCGGSGHQFATCPERVTKPPDQWKVHSCFLLLVIPLTLQAFLGSGTMTSKFPGKRGTPASMGLCYKVENAMPQKCKVYPLSLPESTAMDEYIKEALVTGYIQPSMSLAATSFFFVEKKDGSLRPYIDYRGLNAITVCYPYPLHLVSAALEQLREDRVFTKLDSHSAYNLVRIQEGDEWKTAFHTTKGHYEYLVMSYGLTNASAVFQGDHVCHVKTVLTRLLHHQLFVKAEKCKFHRNSITFLGYVILQKGVEIDISKVRVVTEWPEPTTIKELQRFLGFANFYWQFIQNYNCIANLLASLLRGKPKQLRWSMQARAAFTQLKKSFTTASILRHPDPSQLFIMEVDASSCGIGAVLSQHHGNPGKIYLCAYFSRKLTPAEANYDVGNRGVVLA
ncbi:hypothetical protein QTP70_016468 [Hemibagrus guttatus]|uniref:ribonuclease H n=1 Tax=Hemibagrus guttatus TaxID=175788 RepID=A0AAE0Q4P9_9TELE|nr:hypothetical protein QTP70_016468 [Hemibagrus guttatus]